MGLPWPVEVGRIPDEELGLRPLVFVRAGEPPEPIVLEQRGVHTGHIRKQHGDLDPSFRELQRSVKAHFPHARGFRYAIDLPLMFEKGRIRGVGRQVQRSLRLHGHLLGA